MYAVGGSIHVFIWVYADGENHYPLSPRFAEGAYLTFSNLALDSTNNLSILHIHLQASKTDPFRMGIDIYVGKMGWSFCPVTTVLRYMVMRGSHAGLFLRFITANPPQVCRKRQGGPNLSWNCLEYSGHSFRAEVATTAAKSNFIIRMLGRWKSSAYQV